MISVVREVSMGGNFSLNCNTQTEKYTKHKYTILTGYHESKPCVNTTQFKKIKLCQLPKSHPMFLAMNLSLHPKGSVPP